MNPELEERSRYLTHDECQEIVRKCHALARWGYTEVWVASWHNRELGWARNRTKLSADRFFIGVTVCRYPEEGKGGSGFSSNQIDDASLEGMVRAAERHCKDGQCGTGWVDRFKGAIKVPPLRVPQTAIWSDATSSVSHAERSALARLLTEESEAKDMLSAGYLETQAGSSAHHSNLIMRKGESNPEMSYLRLTQAQCSMTVRHPGGMGSGWAGVSGFDVANIDGPALARRALDKCLASLNPVRIEPGRYTVILEPQAVSQLLQFLMGGSHDGGVLSRSQAEYDGPSTPFWREWDATLQLHHSKLGLKIMDERLTISHDPTDPQLGVIPEPGLEPIVWVKQGILNALHHSHSYAIEQRQRLVGHLFRPAFRVSGGTATIEEMITTTTRGLLVTRFSGVRMVDPASLLATGLTRDGLWLIEKGRISKPVWNMRFTESPLFALNQIEQLGVPTSVFRPAIGGGGVGVGLTPAVVPAMKINDFSFTSLIDAV